MVATRPIGSLELRDRRLSFFVSSLALVAAGGHLMILLFAAVAGVGPLVLFNMASILLYLALFVINRSGHHALVLGVTVAEVLAHAAFATMLLGWEAEFHLYILCLIPLLYYVDRWPVRVRGAASVAVLLAYLALAVAADALAARVPPEPVPLLGVVRYGNMAITAAVLIALSGFYQAAVSRAEAHMQRYSRTLEELSLTDALTGVRNRRGATAELDRAIAFAARVGSPVAILIIDLDHFKDVNDRYGHDAGDALLVSVARAAAGMLRGSDTFGRWGGEEFVVILPEADEAGACLVADRVRDAIGTRAVATADGESISVSATIGVAVLATTSVVKSAEAARTALVNAADRALYEGKNSGRDQVVIAPEVVVTSVAQPAG